MTLLLLFDICSSSKNDVGLEDPDNVKIGSSVEAAVGKPFSGFEMTSLGTDDVSCMLVVFSRVN